MIAEREQEALMRLTMCAREECGMCKYQDTCNFDFQCELATKNMNILADALRADRKTEPQRDCNNCKHKGYEGCEQPCLGCGWCDDYEPKDEPQQVTSKLADAVIPTDIERGTWDYKGKSKWEKTEPTISKMEQVDKDINVRSKDEPQKDCNGCKFVGTYDTEFPCANCSRKTKDYYAKDEPQTEREDE